MKKLKRYKLIFQGKGNRDLRGSKEVLIDFGIKAVLEKLGYSVEFDWKK